MDLLIYRLEVYKISPFARLFPISTNMCRQQSRVEEWKSYAWTEEVEANHVIEEVLSIYVAESTGEECVQPQALEIVHRNLPINENHQARDTLSVPRLGKL
jgi:hypothetical protein